MRRSIRVPQDGFHRAERDGILRYPPGNSRALRMQETPSMPEKAPPVFRVLQVFEPYNRLSIFTLVFGQVKVALFANHQPDTADGFVVFFQTNGISFRSG